VSLGCGATQLGKEWQFHADTETLQEMDLPITVWMLTIPQDVVSFVVERYWNSSPVSLRYKGYGILPSYANL